MGRSLGCGGGNIGTIRHKMQKVAKEEKKVRMRGKKSLLMIGVERDGGTAGIWVLMAGSLAARTFGSRKNT